MGSGESVPRVAVKNHLSKGSNPIFGLEALQKSDESRKVIVTSETSYEWVRERITGNPVVSCASGPAKWREYNWEPLRQRVVVFLLDKVEWVYMALRGGMKPNAKYRTEGISDVLRNHGDCTIKFVLPPPDWAYGSTFAASGWSAEELKNYISRSMRDDCPELVIDAVTSQDEADDIIELDNPHFRYLGYDATQTYYYFSGGSRQIVALAPANHSVANLLTLAPLHWWKKHFKAKTENKGSFDTAAAQDHMLRLSHSERIFSRDKIRGLGAWWDAGRVVVHLGETLVVDGKPVPLDGFETEYIYQRALQISAPLTDPLPDEESRKLLALMDLLPWDAKDSIDGKLLAGAAVLGPACGAWKWRPHVWLTGEAGSGKTWAVDKIIMRLLGGFGQSVASTTTEAALRGLLQSDALPVVFDEIKANGQQAKQRIDNVLGLMRQAASDSQARILKGTSEGGYKAFVIHSMFFIASVNVEFTDAQDASRVTVLKLSSPKSRREDRFSELAVKTAELLTDAYIQRLHARIFGLIPVIRDNVETFAVAVAKIFGNRRDGDQIGTLLAGAYALHSSERITPEAAAQWVGARQEKIVKTKEDDNDLDDKMDLLYTILGHRVTVEIGEGSLVRRVERTLGELALIAGATKGDGTVFPAEAEPVLRRYGLATTERKWLVVSNSLPALREIMRSANYTSNWSRLLAKIPGTFRCSGWEFAGGQRTRAVKIPLDIIRGLPEQPELPIRHEVPGDGDDPADGHEYSDPGER